MSRHGHSFPGGASSLFVLLTVACGDGTADTHARTAEAVQPITERSGIVELDGTTHEFQIVRCDLTGARYDGMLVHGSGLHPDGRRMSVQVERVARDAGSRENVFVSFGSLMDGDVWTVAAHQAADGGWFSDEAMMEPAEGPLLAMSGDEIRADVTFIREVDGTERRGTVRASCPPEP
jgi:hypothetical protein